MQFLIEQLKYTIMIVFINSTSENIPDEINTVGKLMDFKRISRQGTGVGLNGKLVPARDWDATNLKADDRIMVISATYGG